MSSRRPRSEPGIPVGLIDNDTYVITLEEEP